MNKKILVFVGVAIVLVILAAAAFVGVQLLAGQGLPGLKAGGATMLLGESGKPAQYLQTTPAKELPQTPADARGLFDHRQDNSFFDGTGQVQIRINKDQSGNVSTASNHTGPTVEVVVTPQTVVYRDVTMKQFNLSASQAGTPVQQVVEPGNVDEIGENSLVTAWGKTTGDRIIADVLVYTPPPVLVK